ncbi:exoribonuclease family protein [Dothidotthia symphoricarpi CBS 119687]|uniref:Ribosomal RNA-processing protein 43 n=1 Tax=Dothidotthia symphoricarpi CBS 119687 TaxID=1392245 RepID=A0A6A6AJG6_9PLEO|nr:exoribonuclease family protein [Dothidotthia symphoricarpi CBS 119687]KAF2131054.1 exoribonuclease family protein [Dothidotthia symphoricarpi CBS 119687]
MATTAPAHSPALTFPRPIFAAVSPHPFLQAHLSAAKTSTAALRANGRTPHEFRAPGVNTRSLTHCNGSAVVRLGNTSVVCGVRAEILKEADIPGGHEFSPQPTAEGTDEDDREEVDTLRLVVPNVELSTGSTPQHIPGNAPTSYAQTLITRIRSLLLSTRLLRASDLRILYTPSTNPEDASEDAETQLKGYWVLYLDVFFISIDGNAFDAAWISILAALRDTLLPHAYFDEEFEGLLCSDDPVEARRLQLRGLPVPSTFAVFEGRKEDGGEEVDWVLSDPDAFEEGVCQENVCVVVDCAEGKKGTKDAVLRRVEKSGGGVVEREAMKGLVKRAIDRWGVVEAALGQQS